MTELLREDFEVDAVEDLQRGVGMAEIVEPDAREACGLAALDKRLGGFASRNLRLVFLLPWSGVGSGTKAPN